MNTKKTYKDIWIATITKEILKTDNACETLIDHSIAKIEMQIRALSLRETRRKARALHGKHFVPSRFPSAEFLALSLSFRNNKL